MKKLLFLLAIAMAAMSLNAAPVDQATALKKAKSFLTNELYAGKMMAPAALNPVLLKAEMGTKINKPVYYIFNTSTTYLVISGDDRAEEILMIGDEPLDMDRIPCGLQCLLDGYKRELEYLMEHPNLQVERPSEHRDRSLRAVSYGPLLTAKWDQTSPYWDQCKFTYNNTTHQCYTGCPATSAAMVLYYWKHPTTQISVAAYSGVLEISSSNVVSFNYASLPATTFDWNNMKDTYNSWTSTTASKTAVATLMRYVGQAEKMRYGTEAAGGSGIYTNNANIIATMFKNWGYDSNCRRVYKSSYSETNWNNLIINEMAAGRPIVYMAVDNSEGGHAFNVDGYRDSDGKFHVNFGWSGSGNNWYAMNAFSYDGATFNSDQQAIIGIQPEDPTPRMELDPTSLEFTGYAGNAYTQTFTVTGRYLTGNANISVSGAEYTVSPSTLTASQVNAGATVTVTYSPTAAGTHTGTVTVSSSGAESQTVSLTGTASERPVVNTSVTNLSFTASVGALATKTFKVTGVNLADYVYLTVDGEEFSVSQAKITKTAATSGKSITVTYAPTTVGTHTGTITLTSEAAETKTITLNGTATDNSPVINVSPTSLSFSGLTEQTYTKTFTVTGANLTGSLTLSLNDPDDVYTITPRSISASQAANGATVTVTYDPIAAGSHTATVTISGGGAPSKTVSLNGTATEPVRTITVNPASLTFNGLVDDVMTQTFTVTGENLNGNLTLALNNANGVYSISPATITAAEAAAGKTVTVTYAPTVAGDHNATVTVSGGGADSKTVALNGTATEPERTITANPMSLTFNNLVGETSTQTFVVTGVNLKGSDLTLTLNNANGVFSIEPSTITIAEATAGKTVTVTYAPTTFGTDNASITISGGSANPITVNLAGQANLTKYAPVMLEPNDTYVALNRFRAEWTDQTPEENVVSYTLEVNAKVIEPVLLHSLDASGMTGGYGDITLSDPWGGTNLRKATGAIYFRNNYQGANSPGNITYTIPEGYNNATFTMKITTRANSSDGAGNLAVETPQTAAVNHNFTAGSTYSWLVAASSGEKITITTIDANYSPDIVLIEVYSGNATDATLMASESGGTDYRLVTEIAPDTKFYTVTELTDGGTFLYRVKALYIDGTESDWSNIQEVTLHENAHPYAVGDVNHDGVFDVSDVTALISRVLGGDQSACPICGDVTGDGELDVSDVTAVISIVLNSDQATLNNANLPLVLTGGPK